MENERGTRELVGRLADAAIAGGEIGDGVAGGGGEVSGKMSGAATSALASAAARKAKEVERIKQLQVWFISLFAGAKPNVRGSTEIVAICAA